MPRDLTLYVGYTAQFVLLDAAGSELWRGQLADFLGINPDIADKDVRSAERLMPGESCNFGGGAGPLLTFRRVS